MQATAVETTTSGTEQSSVESGSAGKANSQRKRPCRFCADTTAIIEYKEVHVLRTLVTERGKIFPRRVSGVCSKHQRKLAVAIKQARMLALMPFTVTGR